MTPIFIGYDERESETFHVLEQSIMDRCRQPVAIIPLHLPLLADFDGQQDGTNAFIYSRFLVPEIMDYAEWAIYMDSDMLLRADLGELWDLRDDSKAVMVCQHDYKTKARVKAIGTAMESPNTDYPRKNWSSMILWNCGHPSNKIVTRRFAQEAGGKMLHRFGWLNDDEIGSLPLGWNWLVGEYPNSNSAKLVHFTLGAPCFQYYSRCDYSDEWRAARARAGRSDDLQLRVAGGQHV